MPNTENDNLQERCDPDQEVGMSRRTVILGLAGVGALMPLLDSAAGLRHGDDDQDGRDDDDDDRAQPSVLDDGSVEVRITDDDANAFIPGLVTIEQGQTITFVNRDDKDHTATGADWDTGILAPGESGKVTFDRAGEFAYACLIHPVMTGTVVVAGDLASPEASPEAAPQSAGNAVQIFNLAYEPAELAVSVGATVTWTNDDQLPHTVTSADGAFDSGTIGAGETAEITFGEAGSFEYVCAFHPGMRATVLVS